jgi:DNA replication protein DnaC
MAETVAVPCTGCTALVEVEAGSEVARLAQEVGIYCDTCMAAQSEIAREELLPKPLPFSTYCPPCFEDTAFENLPCPAKSKQALEWCFGHSGLNLWGYPGTGKTRTMSLVIKGMLEGGLSVVAFGPGDFRQNCELKEWKRGPWLKKLSSVDVLFIDDLDKMNLTREMEKDFFAVLSNRMGRKPVLMTGNSTGEEITYTFKLGYAMVRRIRDHCLSIHFGQNDINPLPNGHE